MNPRSPYQTLSGCYWLPRFVDKVRLHQQGELPFLYQLALGSFLGIDGYFLRHFKITKKAFYRAVAESKNDQEIENWFSSRKNTTPSQIQAWNQLAPTIGKKGCIGHITFLCVSPLLYPKSLGKPALGIFAGILLDEELSHPSQKES